MIKIVVSPAKSLDYKSSLPYNRYSMPIFIDEAEKLNKVLKKQSVKQLQELMGISPALAELNKNRYQDFKVPFSLENARPAMYAFSGDVYVGLDAYSIPEENLDFAQNTLRILSGMYGILRPFDLIQPYRLEMGTPLKNGRNNNLYHFWSDKITQQLNAEMKSGDVLLNLASVEYFKVVNTKKLNVEIVSPVFKDFKNGQLKIISFFAKKARGLMSRYIIDNHITNVDGILGFDSEGYRYSEQHTLNEANPVFVR